jgi:phosphoglycolate phosphatase
MTIGFDLDLTLVDSRPGIAATYRALSEVDGVPIDVDAVVRRIGPPLEHELAYWYPAAEVPAAVDRYRALYRLHAITPSLALPGAAEAFAAVRAAGGTVIVVTAKKASWPTCTCATSASSQPRCTGWPGRTARPRRCAAPGHWRSSGTTRPTWPPPVPPVCSGSACRPVRARPRT